MNHNKQNVKSITDFYKELSKYNVRVVGVGISDSDLISDVEYFYIPSTKELHLVLPRHSVVYSILLDNDIDLSKTEDRTELINIIREFAESEISEADISFELDENIDFEFVNGGRMFLQNGFMHINDIGLFNDQDTTDLVVISKNPTTNEYGLIFIKRKKAPTGWAFAGGTVEKNEDINENAAKEIKEELGSDMVSHVIYEYDKPLETCEMRGSLNTSITIFYSPNGFNEASAGDDAAETAFVPVSDLNELVRNKFIDVKEGRLVLIPHHQEILEKVINDSKSNDKFNRYFTGI